MELTTGNLRLDLNGTVTGVRRTPQGGLIAPANLTRVGVFTYQTQDGKQVRELRLPEEVFKADSLATLAAAPLTVGHPQHVTPDNYREVNVGHVDGMPKQADRFVAADLRVMDRSTIERVEKKDLVEVSCGYTCDIEPSSGEWGGEKYDAIQRNIQYNHVALGPRDWGRAGNEVKIRLDSGYAISGITSEVAPYLNIVSTPDQKTPVTPAPAPTSAESKQDSDSRFDALKGENAFLKSENERLKGELATANDPKRLDAAVQARVALVAKATTAVPAIKCDGKSDADVMREVVTALTPDVKLDGATTDYVRGMFEAATRADTKTKQGTVQLSTPTPENAKDESARQDSVSAAQERMADRNKNAWRPASASK